MGQQKEIHERIFQFVVRGLKILPYIPPSSVSSIVINQYTRAITSVGANDTEADGTITKKDFIHICTIVRKELKETRYWLRIISELYPQLSSRLTNILQENEELILIISTIINNTNKK